MNIKNILVLLVAVTGVWAQTAAARPSIAIETGADDNDILFGNLPFEIELGDVYDGADSTANPSPFGINIGGTTYRSVFINPNGLITLGQNFGDAPPPVPLVGMPLAAMNQPAFALFFTEIASASRVTYGRGFGTTWLGFLGAGLQDSDGRTARAQLGIRNKGLGDFDLIFNYEGINIPGAQAGFTDGITAFNFPGAGNYTGDDDSASCVAPSLSCYNTNPVPGTIINTLPALGRHIFSFRNGVAQVAPVPEPSSLSLLALLLVVGFARRKLA